MSEWRDTSLDAAYQRATGDDAFRMVKKLEVRVDNLTNLCLALAAYVGKVHGLDVKELTEHLDKIPK